MKPERCNHVFVQDGDKHCCTLEFPHSGKHEWDPEAAMALIRDWKRTY